MNRTPTIKYTDRDFPSIRKALLDYSKKYYPDTFKDLNEAGINALLIDLVSYTGDVLSFYLDYQANESFLQTAVEFTNILRHGKSLGYKHSENPTSSTIASFYIIVPVATDSNGPDRNFLPILKRNSTFSSDSGANFLLVEDVDFSNENNAVVVAARDSVSGSPLSFAVKAMGRVISGTRSRETVKIGSYKKFLRVEMTALDIAEIESVVDQEGHVYYEVDHLSQNTVYKAILNRGDDRDLTPSLMQATIVPRRFVVDRERRKTYLQFGYGSDSTLFDTNIADPSNVMLKMVGKDYVSSTSFDPNKLLTTDKFGVVPSNTVLTINYRSNTTDNVNAPVGTLRSVLAPQFTFDNVESLNSSTVRTVVASLEVDNEEPIVGDVTLSSVEEIKQRIFDSYATQNRAVTALDYAALLYNMPPQFGKIKRVGVNPSSMASKREIEIYLVCEDSSGNLVPANSSLKQNAKVWLSKHKMLHDFLTIADAYVVNLGIEYEAKSNLSRNKYDIQVDVNSEFLKTFAQKKNVGEPFYLNDVYDTLKSVSGVMDITRVKIVQKRGNVGDKRYSSVSFNPDSHYSDDGRYINCPKNVVFEIKYVNSDVKGSIN